jgi:hypothetical protein
VQLEKINVYLAVKLIEKTVDQETFRIEVEAEVEHLGYNSDNEYERMGVVEL